MHRRRAAATSPPGGTSPANTRRCGAPSAAVLSIHVFTAAISASRSDSVGFVNVLPTALPLIATPRRKARRRSERMASTVASGAKK